MENNKAVLFELNIENDRCIFPNTISDAIIDANKELKDLEDKLNETLETIRLLTPECDKLDYILSVSSGALCGIMDSKIQQKEYLVLPAGDDCSDA